MAPPYGFVLSKVPATLAGSEASYARCSSLAMLLAWLSSGLSISANRRHTATASRLWHHLYCWQSQLGLRQCC
jgi:hypothetical protein